VSSNPRIGPAQSLLRRQETKSSHRRPIQARSLSSHYRQPTTNCLTLMTHSPYAQVCKHPGHQLLRCNPYPLIQYAKGSSASVPTIEMLLLRIIILEIQDGSTNNHRDWSPLLTIEIPYTNLSAVAAGAYDLLVGPWMIMQGLTNHYVDNSGVGQTDVDIHGSDEWLRYSSTSLKRYLRFIFSLAENAGTRTFTGSCRHIYKSSRISSPPLLHQPISNIFPALTLLYRKRNSTRSGTP
jgi:hypothetical protein